jgi:hypothetical protein
VNLETQSKFRDALQSLETCLETPRVSGELERWIASVEKSVNLIASLLPKQIERQHAARLRQIATDDPQLSAEVERVKCGDDAMRDQFDKIRERTNQLVMRATKVEPDESRLDEALSELTSLGLAFVIHARKQEIAIETWQQEAVYRDIGGSG